ncbi:Family S53 protease-like protein [Mycena indigotica]|uniref:Family S53 protease-like protein n=1 Tax=Mycena indigotica TaxID=2126181 RepID=A0A8H6TF79_9AGAR|nr:Family S53 protease-like protein [Mycena indigotica]KAF7316159.1 Family S53 protease-like protein [Mycena indigotica]
MVLLSTSFFAALVAVTVATPAERSALVIHERRDTPARGFVKTGPAPPSRELTLHIALKPNNIAGLEEELYAVSDPKSDTLQFTVPVSQASAMLDAEFAKFAHSGSNQTTIRTLQYSLPADLAGHVAYVHPTTSFTNPFATPKIEPYDVKRKQMGLPKGPATQRKNVLGISGFTNEFANFNDLKDFLARFRPDMPSSTKFDVQLLDGGANTQQDHFSLKLHADKKPGFVLSLASKQ